MTSETVAGDVTADTADGLCNLVWHLRWRNAWMWRSPNSSVSTNSVASLPGTAAEANVMRRFRGHCRCTIRAATVTSYIDTAITKPSRDSCKLHSTLRLRITYRNSRGKKSTLYNISHHIHTSQQAPDVKTTHVFVFCVRKTSK